MDTDDIEPLAKPQELKDLEADALFPFPYAPILELFHQIHIFLSQKTS